MHSPCPGDHYSPGAGTVRHIKLVNWPEEGRHGGLNGPGDCRRVGHSITEGRRALAGAGAGGGAEVIRLEVWARVVVFNGSEWQNVHGSWGRLSVGWPLAASRTGLAITTNDSLE